MIWHTLLLAVLSWPVAANSADIDLVRNRVISAPNAPATYELRVNADRPMTISRISAEVALPVGQVPTVVVRRAKTANSEVNLDPKVVRTTQAGTQYRIDRPLQLKGKPGEVFIVEIRRFGNASGPMRINWLAVAVEDPERVEVE